MIPQRCRDALKLECTRVLTLGLSLLVSCNSRESSFECLELCRHCSTWQHL